MEPTVALEREGLRCVAAPVGIDGTVDLRALAGLIGDDTLLVCVMAASNETGVLQSLEAVVAHAQAAGGLRRGAQCGAAAAASGLVIP
ncbi:aminotransferase class V-fold PLP-dependent enzyme [Caulobacter sp. ErkDOM-E]|uniref:aminotransferase class V-fold PLP-dependent enzyme n=1 Tax=Caulobacter sp. ErkDOM-E TaxID=3402778 RepID=UPI003AF40D26